MCVYGVYTRECAWSPEKATQVELQHSSRYSLETWSLTAPGDSWWPGNPSDPRVFDLIPLVFQVLRNTHGFF